MSIILEAGMRVLQAISVAARQLLLGALGATGVSLCVWVGVSGLNSLEASSRRALVAKDIVADVLPPPLYLIELRLVLSQAVEGALTPSQASDSVERLTQDYEARLAYWRRQDPSPVSLGLLGDQDEHARSLFNEAAKVLSALRQGEEATARLKLGAAHRHYLNHRVAVDATVRAANEMAIDSIGEFAKATRRARSELMAILAITLLIGGALSVLVARSIVRPLRRAMELADSVADGDLTASIEVSGRDEMAQLQRSLNTMCRRLAETAHGVRLTGDRIGAIGKALAASNLELDQRTQLHRQELLAVHEALGEINLFIRESASASDNAKQMALDASRAAERGVHAIASLAASMQSVDRSGHQVAQMVCLIDDIARRTGLLALNASVEAARASGSGRGFAVIAGEVRALAGHSSQAATQIAEEVRFSRGKVNEGSLCTDAARVAFDDMAEQTALMKDLVSTIWETTFAQASGISLLKESVEELKSAADANAAMVRSNTTAAMELDASVAGLEHALRHFRTGSAADRAVGHSRAGTDLLSSARVEAW